MRALRPYRVELARDYGLSMREIDEEWGRDDLLALVLDVHGRCRDGQYRIKRR